MNRDLVPAIDVPCCRWHYDKFDSFHIQSPAFWHADNQMLAMSASLVFHGSEIEQHDMSIFLVRFQKKKIIAKSKYQQRRRKLFQMALASMSRRPQKSPPTFSEYDAGLLFNIYIERIVIRKNVPAGSSQPRLVATGRSTGTTLLRESIQDYIVLSLGSYARCKVVHNSIATVLYRSIQQIHNVYSLFEPI